MRIDFDYLEDLYNDDLQVESIRKTKIVDDFEEVKKPKKTKEYKTARVFKYEGYNGN
jgi:hypothetical protein